MPAVTSVGRSNLRSDARSIVSPSGSRVSSRNVGALRMCVSRADGGNVSRAPAPNAMFSTKYRAAASGEFVPAVSGRTVDPTRQTVREFLESGKAEWRR